MTSCRTWNQSQDVNALLTPASYWHYNHNDQSRQVAPLNGGFRSSHSMLSLQPESDSNSSRQVTFGSSVPMNAWIAKLRVFGCKCFPCLHPYKASKLDIKSLPCIFVGYSVQRGSYLYLVLANRQIFSSRDIVFDELDFSLNTSLFEGMHCNEISDLGKILVGNFGNRVNSSSSPTSVPSPDKIPNVNIDLPPQVSDLATRPNYLPGSDSGCVDTSATET